MRGIQIDITLDLLLDFFQLKRGNIELHHAVAKMNDIISIGLTGDDDRLPEITEKNWPIGTIECRRIESKIKV